MKVFPIKGFSKKKVEWESLGMFSFFSEGVSKRLKRMRWDNEWKGRFKEKKEGRQWNDQNHQ